MPNTVILATQRTGSTLLCSEFAAIGGLGRPGEHFLPWLRAHPDETMTRGAFDKVCDEGRDPSGAVGLKLMADYLPRIADALGAGASDSQPDARAAALLELIADRIGPLTLYRIDRRDRFAQALSRYLAAATGVYFRATDGSAKHAPGKGAPTPQNIAELLASFDIARIEHLLERIEAECRFLDAVSAHLAQPVLFVSYEALVEEREAILPACCAHAGIRAPETLPVRWMTKVVKETVGQHFRTRATAIWRDRERRGEPLPETVRALLREAEEGRATG